MKSRIFIIHHKVYAVKQKKKVFIKFNMNINIIDQQID